MTTNFSLSVKGDCALTSLIDLTISDMTVKVSNPAVTQDVNFTNTKAVTYSNPIFCGLRTFAWTPSLPAFLTIDAGLTTLTLVTSTPTDAGVYAFSFTVSLVDFPAVPGITKNF